MDTLLCDITLNADTVSGIYGGRVRYVQALARDGRQVRFPALLLRPFITHQGISGTFAITIDAQHRLQSVQRV